MSTPRDPWASWSASWSMTPSRSYVDKAVALHSDREEALSLATERARAERNRQYEQFNELATATLGDRLSRHLALAFGGDADTPEFADITWTFPLCEGPTQNHGSDRYVVQPRSGQKAIELETTFQGVPVVGQIALPGRTWSPGSELTDAVCSYAVRVDYRRVEFRDLASFGGAVKMLRLHERQAQAQAAHTSAARPRPWWQRLW